MAENINAQHLFSPDSKPRKIASLLESVPQQYRQEFGSGNLVIGNGIEIKGEGEERKLHTVIYPQDPEYEEYENHLSEFTGQRIQWVKERTNELATHSNQIIQRAMLQVRANLLAKDQDPYQDPYAELLERL